MVADSMLEIWQADAQGRFSDPQDNRALPNSSFKGFGHAFDTIKAGSVPDPAGKAAGVVSRARGFRARHAVAALHPDLLRR